MHPGGFLNFKGATFNDAIFPRHALQTGTSRFFNNTAHSYLFGMTGHDIDPKVFDAHSGVAFAWNIIGQRVKVVKDAPGLRRTVALETTLTFANDGGGAVFDACGHLHVVDFISARQSSGLELLKHIADRSARCGLYTRMHAYTRGLVCMSHHIHITSHPHPHHITSHHMRARTRTHTRACVDECVGACVDACVRACRWGGAENGWNAPLISDSLFIGPEAGGRACGIWGPMSSFVTIANTTFASFLDGAAICFCKLCVGVKGGQELRSSGLRFSQDVRSRVSFGHHYDGIFFDLDGSLTGIRRGWLHGSDRYGERSLARIHNSYVARWLHWLHAPRACTVLALRALLSRPTLLLHVVTGGLGSFPPEHCELVDLYGYTQHVARPNIRCDSARYNCY